MLNWFLNTCPTPRDCPAVAAILGITIQMVGLYVIVRILQWAHRK